MNKLINLYSNSLIVAIPVSIGITTYEFHKETKQRGYVNNIDKNIDYVINGGIGGIVFGITYPITAPIYLYHKLKEN